MEQLVDLINKIFQKQQTAFLVGLVGVCLSFAIITVLGLFLGDFARAKRALGLIGKGRIQEGKERLSRTIPALANRTGCEQEEGLTTLCSAVKTPFDYSLTKKMPSIMLVCTCFFAGVSLISSLSLSGIFAGYAVMVFFVVGGLGLCLCALALALKSSMLKGAILEFYRASAALPACKESEITEESGGEGFAHVTHVPNTHVPNTHADKARGEKERVGRGADDFVRGEFAARGSSADVLPAEIISLCARIEEVALEGGADHRTLSDLYGEIKHLQRTADTPAAEAKLAAALEILIVLIDSAL